MASNVSKIALPSGTRTPSPTKSRLPVGAAGLSQRAAPTKGFSNTSLPPTSRKPSSRGLETTKRPALSTSKLSQKHEHIASCPPNTFSEPRANISVGPSRKLNQQFEQLENSTSSTTPSSRSVSRGLVFSRELLDSRLELLHLHAIHKSSTVTQTDWRENAFTKYKQDFEALQRRNGELNQKEIEITIQGNATALLSWSSPSNRLENQIQILSSVVSEIDSLTSGDGRYSLAVQVFDRWINPAMAIIDQQAETSSRTNSKMIGRLGDGWTAEIEYLQSRLVTFADLMLSLPELITGGSDLRRTITTMSEILKNMLEELDMISALETLILQEEKDRVEGSIASLTKSLGEDLSLK